MPAGERRRYRPPTALPSPRAPWPQEGPGQAPPVVAGPLDAPAPGCAPAEGAPPGQQQRPAVRAVRPLPVVELPPGRVQRGGDMQMLVRVDADRDHRPFLPSAGVWVVGAAPAWTGLN